MLVYGVSTSMKSLGGDSQLYTLSWFYHHCAPLVSVPSPSTHTIELVEAAPNACYLLFSVYITSLTTLFGLVFSVPSSMFQ